MLPTGFTDIEFGSPLHPDGPGGVNHRSGVEKGHPMGDVYDDEADYWDVPPAVEAI